MDPISAKHAPTHASAAIKRPDFYSYVTVVFEELNSNFISGSRLILRR
jgi:hypothetical protein